MARPTKHNYDALYAEFVQTKHDALLPFLREKGILAKGANTSQLSDSVKRHFKGWANKKRADLDVSNIDAKVSVVESSLEKWKKIYKNVEQGDMKMLQEFVVMAVKGMPTYFLKKDGDIDFKKGENGVKGYRPLTFHEKMTLWDKFRLAQGKASEITLSMVLSATGDEGSDPMRARLNEMKKSGLYKKTLRLIEKK